MPSFNRLLVLAVLALSASVQSAPVGDAAPTDLSNVNGATTPSLVPASVDDFDEEEAGEDLDARDFDEEDDEDLEARDVDEDDDEDELEARGFDEDDDEDELEARDFDDEDEDEDLDARDVNEDDEDDEDSSLERRSKKKKTSPKVPKAKTTKAPKPKATKTPKPKTTKAKTTKVKTTKAPKPTATKPAKTTKAKTTKPAKTKSAKPTKTKSAKPTKTKSAKPEKTSKASKTTKATGTAKPSACPIKKPTKPAKKPRMFARAFDYVAHLFARDNEEFIGWHGTNSDTAAFWESKGQLEKPTKADGVLDFLGLGPKSTSGTSGADAEIGPGVYVTDDQDIAVAFANNNANVNKGTTAQLCAIFAKSSSNWRTAIRKSFIPENLVGDSADAAKKKQLEDARIAHVKKAVPGVSATSVVKFSLLNRRTHTGQLVLPATITNQFLAKCFKADGGAAASGTSKFPAFSYNGQTLRTQWNIAAETAGECS